MKQNTDWIVISCFFLDLVLCVLCWGETLKLIIFTSENTTQWANNLVNCWELFHDTAGVVVSLNNWVNSTPWDVTLHRCRNSLQLERSRTCVIHRVSGLLSFKKQAFSRPSTSQLNSRNLQEFICYLVQWDGFINMFPSYEHLCSQAHVQNECPLIYFYYFFRSLND